MSTGVLSYKRSLSGTSDGIAVHTIFHAVNSVQPTDAGWLTHVDMLHELLNGQQAWSAVLR